MIDIFVGKENREGKITAGEIGELVFVATNRWSRRNLLYFAYCLS